MKKLFIATLSIAAVALVGAAAGCAKKQQLPTTVVNGGFESADLSGWTVEYGDAYDDNSVSSRKTFSYTADIDPHGYVIPVNQTGNWYLSGRGFDNKRPSTCTGAIRSQNFVLSGDGNISMKLAGGAQAMARSDTAEQKPVSEVCYVGIYRASDDKMLASQTNRYFAEDSSNIELSDYENGTCYTDNFCQYNIDLSDYIGEELYIRIVDNDANYYYGYLSVDDIRIGKSAEAQQEGAYFSKSAPQNNAQADSVYDIANGGFESGNISGWEVTEGLAFSDDGVNANPYWWAEQIPYERDGNYHYGYYNPTATGRMKSSVFIVGGTGYATYKLGGCADNNTAYLRFMEVNENGADRELFRVSNFAYKDMQFPNVQNGMRVINLTQYRLNLSPFTGKKLYIEVVDENPSDNMAGCVVLDSVKTYYTAVPQFTDWFDVEYNPDNSIPESEYQVINGGFETGNLDGWTMDGNLGGVVRDKDFKKDGNCLLWGEHEGGDDTKWNYRGTLTSSPFKVGGRCIMTFKLGGAKDPRFCYISLLEGETEVARLSNTVFHGAEMVTYRFDLTRWKDKTLRIRIYDGGEFNECYIVADSFITYYEDNDVSRFPADSIEAINLLTLDGNRAESEYQIKNGNFEEGNLNGWDLNGNIGNISYQYIWWNEWYTYNKSGLYFFSGFEGNEGETGTLTSSAFTVGGSGMITYRFGGGMSSSLCYIEVIDENNPELVYYRFGNQAFSNQGGVFIGYPITVGCDGFGAKMVLYKADLSKLIGKRVKLRLTDNASKDWGLLFADDFVTYYENKDQVPANAVLSTNILPVPEFEDVKQTLNFNYNQNTVALRPKEENKSYKYSFKLAEAIDEISIKENVITLTPQGDIPATGKTYTFTVEVTMENILLGEKITHTFNVELAAINDNRQILNGNFESGDLTGWTVTNGNVHTETAVSSVETFLADNLPYNKEGKYHFDGWGAQYAEADTYSLRSEKFILGGSGFISFKMAGRSAVLKVYKSDGTKIAEYDNTKFADVHYPHVDDGCRLATMITFVADLHEYIGSELYIEICDDKAGGNWGVVFFDDIKTYYETAPNVEESKDMVHLNASASKTGSACDYDLEWVVAENKI